MDKGFVIMAQGLDYEVCADVLKQSILHVMPDSNVTIITTDMLPYGDQLLTLIGNYRTIGKSTKQVHMNILLSLKLI